MLRRLRQGRALLGALLLLTGVYVSRFQLEIVDYKIEASHEAMSLRGGRTHDAESPDASQRRLDLPSIIASTIWGVYGDTQAKSYGDTQPGFNNIDPNSSDLQGEGVPPALCGGDVDSFILLRNRALGAYVHVNASDGRMYPYAGPLGSIAPRAFRVVPTPEARRGGGVMLRSVATGKFVRRLSEGEEGAGGYVADGEEEALQEALGEFVFEIQEETYLFHPLTGVYMGVVDGSDGALYGDDTFDPLQGNQTSVGEGAVEWVVECGSGKDLEREGRMEAAGDRDEDLVQLIRELSPSSERRVISFGLYGSMPKYMQGALRNMELIDTYFPGWTARFYVDCSVPPEIITQLKDRGAEIVVNDSIRGGIAGMFWRFLIADDPTVDRYIVRDSDSRLNARDRLAVEEWIRSNRSIHTLRDHVNHCIPMNGGMWGGTRGAIQNITSLIHAWSSKDEFFADQYFLMNIVWPLVQHDQMAHDAFCCEKFPNTRPFPTRRHSNYQHVGQVFDENNNPRMSDIDHHLRGVESPKKCRRRPEWLSS